MYIDIFLFYLMQDKTAGSESVLRVRASFCRIHILHFVNRSESRSEPTVMLELRSKKIGKSYY